jgi:hypothetical protein
MSTSECLKQAGIVVCHDPLIFKGEETRMKKTTLVSLLAAGLALLSTSSAFSAPLNPTPNRESKLLVGFEDQTTVMSDPDGVGENRASINADPQFVAEGSKSLKLELTGVGGYKDYFAIDLPAPIDIKGYQVLSMDVYVPVASLNNGDYKDNAWFEFLPRPTTADPADATMTVDTQYGNRAMGPGWNHLIWDLKNGTDTKITKLAFVGNTNGDKPYSGPVYVDNIRVYKGSFTGIQPDEKLIFGFDKPTDKDFFTGPVAYAVSTDKQFVHDGNGSLKIDLTNQDGGWTNDVARADNWGKTVDVSNATAIHLDLFVPDGSQPTSWNQLGFVVIGEGGDAWGTTSGGVTGGFIPGQWNTLELALTPDQAKALTNVKGLYLIRNQDSNTPWNGPIYIDNLRAVVPAP